MLEFRYHANYVPPGGKWFYTVPETGRTFISSENIDTVIDQVKRHYAVNKLTPPDNLPALVENFICLHIQPGFCLGLDPRSKDDVPPTYFEIVAFLEDYFRSKKHGGLVAVSEADKRATVCVRCQENSLGFCMSCSGLRDHAARMAGGRKLPQDQFLGVCKRARLPCNALVHVNNPPAATKLPDNCWMVTK